MNTRLFTQTEWLCDWTRNQWKQWHSYGLNILRCWQPTYIASGVGTRGVQ